MDLTHSVALVTGANRGLGRAFAAALLARGAGKVYAAARDPSTIDLPGVVPVRLDVTNAAEVAAAARSLGDVNLLINNAGIIERSSVLNGDLAALRREMETNFFGTLAVSQAFAPVLGANGGGALVNVLSVLSWVTVPGTAMYSASKAAAWALTNALRQELAAQNTLVTALHVGYMDTDMAAHVQTPKANPADVANQVLDAVRDGREEVLADELSRQVKAGLAADPGVYLRRA
ncbi:SDR family oxidoreductase [Tahibacter sp. UC22_41]|uniref:SDR family oxidoreductase n=1 Tax=Tahibacter sp. UC22_41 TaxID=3350178 RepID=UPI0036D827F1